MKNFINIVFDKIEEVDDIVVESVATSASNALMESETNYSLFEDEGKTILAVETHVQLTEEESNEVAHDIANTLFDLGYESFDIEVSV
jgi:predicted ATP-grasp superfamily ATP-dependent carboligase